MTETETETLQARWSAMWAFRAARSWLPELSTGRLPAHLCWHVYMSIHAYNAMLIGQDLCGICHDALLVSYHRYLCMCMCTCACACACACVFASVFVCVYRLESARDNTCTEMTDRGLLTERTVASYTTDMPSEACSRLVGGGGGNVVLESELEKRNTGWPVTFERRSFILRHVGARGGACLAYYKD